MKRVLSLIIILLLVLPALAEPMSWLDYTDDLLEDGSPVYYFPELSITLPADWNGKVVVMAEEARTAFYQRASYEKYQAEGLDGGGFLFALGACVNQSFTELPSFEYIGFSEESAMNYYLELPSDYPAYMDDAIREEYDAMAAQIGWVAEHAVIYAGTAEIIEEGDAAGEAAEVPGEAKSTHTLSEVRYFFEHNLMPRYFHEVPEDMLDTIRARGLYVLWESITTENGVDPTYPAGDFVTHWYTAVDGTTLAQIEMPGPEENLQCFRIYMVYDPATRNTGYYTVEYDNFLEETSFICGWTAEGDHVNYSGAPILERGGDGYEEALQAEAAQIAALAGISAELTAQ